MVCGNGSHRQAGRGRLTSLVENLPANVHTQFHLQSAVEKAPSSSLSEVGQGYRRHMCVVRSARDHLPFCEELPYGADAICGMQRRGHTGGCRCGRGTMGLRRAHHSANQSQRLVRVVGTTPAVDVEVPNSRAGYQRGHPGRRDVLGLTFSEARAWFSNTEQHEGAQTAERLSMWFCHRQQMLGEDPAVNEARARGLRRVVATVG